MPIYEYRCRDCGKRSALLILSLSNPGTPSCKHCQSPNLERLLSRFAAPKSEEARLETLADPGSYGDLDENDPKSMARFMKKMGKELGDDLGEDFEDELDAALEEETGESAESDPIDVD
ncbi:FmdB family zinc ribbon protein [Nitrospira sp. Kam-Ns4a]